MTSTHRRLACRDLDTTQYLCHLAQITFQNRRRNRGPNQSLRNPRIVRIKRMKIRIRLPLLEHQLNLPPQAIHLTYCLGRESVP